MNRRSIGFRLTALYAGILASILAVVGLGAWLAIRDSINETVDKELRGRLAAMREFIQRESAGNPGSRALDEVAENAAFAPAGTHFRLANDRGRWLYESPGAASWGAVPALSDLPARGRIATVTEAKKPIRVLTAPLPGSVVQIGIGVDEYEEMLDAFTWTALLATPVLLLLASAGGYWMSRRALAPVQQIARTAGEIQAQKLSSRLPLRGTGDELDRLSEVLNDMLGRLEESFRRITQFTADASHELRTPVAIIRTTAEVIRRKKRSEHEYDEALDRILIESERTTALIEDLMLLARADEQALPAALEPLDLAWVVRAACAEIRPLAGSRMLQLLEEDGCDCWITGEETALRRLLLILLDNAIKYSQSGGQILVALETAKDPLRDVAVLEVRDRGIGISREDLPHIFDRFYRASKDRSRATPGAGLGLSIARCIVEQHGGEIQAFSELGEGCTVRVTLPAVSKPNSAVLQNSTG